MMKLWLVEINYDDFEYDYFVDGVVWAETSESAEQSIREGVRLPRGSGTRLTVKEAPTSGVAHIHIHAG